MHAYKTTTDQYDLPAIRTLLPRVFDDPTFALFCYDHFPHVYQKLTRKMSLEQKTDCLVDACHQQTEGLGTTFEPRRLRLPKSASTSSLYTSTSSVYVTPETELDHLLQLIRTDNPHQYLEYDPVFRKIADTHKANLIQPTRFFISHNSRLPLDQAFAAYLYHFLVKVGHHVFLNDYPPKNQQELTTVDHEIKRSQFVIALLSEDSVDNEMLRAEINRAYTYQQADGHPDTLLICLAYEGLLPYSIETILKHATTFNWHNQADHERIAQEILALVEQKQTLALPETNSPPPTSALPLTVRPERQRIPTDELLVSEDGRPIHDAEKLYPPMPEFDPRFLDELSAPGGAVKVRDRFYIERLADSALQRQLKQPGGTTTTIRAARQMGKSSLLVRGMHQARQRQAKIVYIDLQGMDERYFGSLELFLRHLAELIVRRLRLDVSELERNWRSSYGSKDNITYFMEDYILRHHDHPIVLALDEVDLLVQPENAFHTEFFSLLRSWHNNRATNFEGLWDKLYIVMAISTEPYLLIEDVHQSPFNVGLKIFLEGFDPTQMYELNWQHGTPIRRREFGQFVTLLNGHPYLTRKALYTLVTQNITWSELSEIADDDNGPFNDHLLRNYWLLTQNEELAHAFLEIIRHNRYHDDIAVLRLLKAGLITGEGNTYAPLCDLYRRYFESRL